jgi:hypothetical protein
VAEFLRNAAAQTFVEHSAEARMQLNFLFRRRREKRYCRPAGSQYATSGAAKDRNLGMIFMDRIDIITAHATRVASQ